MAPRRLVGDSLDSLVYFAPPLRRSRRSARTPCSRHRCGLTGDVDFGNRSGDSSSVNAGVSVWVLGRELGQARLPGPPAWRVEERLNEKPLSGRRLARRHLVDDGPHDHETGDEH